MAKYIVEIPDEIEISKDSQLVPFDMCRPSWWEEAYNKGKADAEQKRGEMMDAKEMLEKVQEFKEQCLLNGFRKSAEIDKFFAKNWIQILDILNDALYAYLNLKR